MPLMKSGNRTSISFNVPLGGAGNETQNWLIKQAQLNPDRLAVSDGQTSYTFAQLLTVVKLMQRI